MATGKVEEFTSIIDSQGRCGQCQHWQNFTTAHRSQKVGYCIRVKSEDASLESAEKLDLPIVIDYPVADLITRFDFGCVLFEQKVS